MEQYIDILTYIVTIASLITGFTNTPKDDNVLSKAYKIIEVLAIVTNKAKQK